MRPFLAITALCLALGGCGSGSGTASESATAAADAVKDSTIAEQDVKSGDTQIISDPAQAEPGGSYRIEPSDPSDPKFRADPALGGGG